jgi:hypothetical protein
MVIYLGDYDNYICDLKCPLHFHIQQLFYP